MYFFGVALNLLRIQNLYVPKVISRIKVNSIFIKGMSSERQKKLEYILKKKFSFNI